MANFEHPDGEAGMPPTQEPAAGLSAKGVARMVFTAEIGSTAMLQKALAAISEVPDVQDARRQ